MKKLLSIILIFTLVFTSMSIGYVEAAGERFTDVKSTHWAYNTINELVDLGVINGYSDGTFKPSKEIRIDEFIKLTVTALGYFPDGSFTKHIGKEMSIYNQTALKFSDHISQLVAKWINQSLDFNIVKATKTGKDTITDVNPVHYNNIEVTKSKVIKGTIEEEIIAPEPDPIKPISIQFDVNAPHKILDIDKFALTLTETDVSHAVDRYVTVEC